MNESSTEAKPKWRPLTSVQRRVLGVLLEKAKTTPASYPMSLNAVTTACNQKSNRSPLMSLEPEDVEDTLEQLREMGAVGFVEGFGRVCKYRHYAYEFFAIEKPEAAVLAELLLRGEQTVGELRGRAARMEKSISDVASLRPLLRSLQEKRLVIAITPEGRGQVVTHGVFESHEMPSAAAAPTTSTTPATPAPVSPSPPAPPSTPPAASESASLPLATAPAPCESPPPAPGVTRDMFNELQLEVAELRAELSRLRNHLEQLEDLMR